VSVTKHICIHLLSIEKVWYFLVGSVELIDVSKIQIVATLIDELYFLMSMWTILTDSPQTVVYGGYHVEPFWANNLVTMFFSLAGSKTDLS
jgi:hypothetical protein